MLADSPDCFPPGAESFGRERSVLLAVGELTQGDVR